MTFGRAFMVGLMTTAVASVLLRGHLAADLPQARADFGEKYRRTLWEGEKSGATEAQIAAKRKEAADFQEVKNPP